MYIKFEPSGTHVHKDHLKVRLDFFPDPADKAYAIHYVYVPVFPPEGYPGKVDADGYPTNQVQYDKWVASLPHIWQLNPCICVFIRVDENITKEFLTQYIGDIYTANVIATLDNALIQPNSAHLVSPYMKDKSTLSSVKTLSFDEAAKNEINTRLAGLNLVGELGGEITEIETRSIDIGPGTFSGSSYGLQNYTVASSTNPANADGILDTYEIWLAAKDTTCDIYGGVFSADGNVLTCRDSEQFGDVAVGSKQTLTPITITVNTGDYIGACSKGSNNVTLCYKGADGPVWYKADEYIDTTDSATFSTYGPRDYALYATGEEAGWANIKNIRMGTGTVLATDISHIWFGTTAVAVADIAEINGVAV